MLSATGATTQAPAPATPAGTDHQATPLAALRHGQRARIHTISTVRGEQIARRLADLGLEPGRTITVERRAPMGDPTVYHVADYHISLRARDAALITVHLEDETR